MEKAPGPLGESGVRPWRDAARVPQHAAPEAHTQTWPGTERTELNTDKGRELQGAPRVAAKQPCHNAMPGRPLAPQQGNALGPKLRPVLSVVDGIFKL